MFCDVLVVGAGPAGLTAAIELTRRGVDCAIVDRRTEPRPGTRGCTVWQRTLEVFSLMDLPVARYEASGVRFQRRVYHVMDSEPIEVDVSEPASQHPLPLLVGQQVTEAMLTEHLSGLGVPVRRGMAAATAREIPGGGVRVDLRGNDGQPVTVVAGWVVVAEGSRSALRQSLGIGWSGQQFPGTQLLQVDAFVPDGALPGSPRDAHLHLVPEGTLGDLPLPDGRRRLFLSVPDPDPANDGDPSVAEIEPLVRRLSRRPGVVLSGGRFNWRVRLYNSIAETFRSGRCLLVGDSARTFMPVAAQGMNTGIQDAFNLGWKLAAVVNGQAGTGLLDTYMAERRPVALAQIERAERGFWAGLGTPPPLEQVLAGIRRQRTVRTELALSYAGGPLAEDLLGGAAAGGAGGAAGEAARGNARKIRGTAGEAAGGTVAGAAGPAAGDRAPDATGVTTIMRRGGWTLLDPGGQDRGWLAEARQHCPGRLETVRAPLAGHAAYGAERGAICLIRPDGYIGFRGGPGTGQAMVRYLKRVAAREDS
jgi:2-polyprenyl-6-methoxyphenol hydroxylase-like FAD-dependent oxidoreductase